MIRTFLLACLLGLAGCGHMASKDPAPVRTAAESRVTEVKTLAAIHDALAESGARSTLLVLDIDDTLLTSKTFFGSDRWYEWQKELKAGDPGFVPCKFDVIALNYEAGTQTATEGSAGRDLVNGLPGDKLILTARNPGYRGGTVRELLAAEYTLPAMLGTGSDGQLFVWRATPEAKPVTISYQDGVMMVSGQDKGKTLVALLDRLKLRYDRVVLVDDGRKNIDNMQAALREAGIDYHGLWYTKIVKTITPADKVEGVSGWNAMRAWLQTVFPERLARMEANRCFY